MNLALDPRKVEELSTATQLAEGMADLIAARGCVRPTVTKQWVADMDKLIRLDGRTVEQVVKTLKWLQQANDETSLFWQPNIRSPRKLRMRWDQMREQYELKHKLGLLRAQTSNRPGDLLERLESKARMAAADIRVAEHAPYDPLQDSTSDEYWAANKLLNEQLDQARRDAIAERRAS